MIELRTIDRKRLPRTSVGRAGKPARRVDPAIKQRHEFTHSGGVTRCTRCPPQRTRSDPLRFCDECRAINNARHQAGLIRPAGDPRPSADNIYNRPTVGNYRGGIRQSEYIRSTTSAIVLFVEQLGGGWRRGVATLKGVRVHVGPKTRSTEDAWAFCKNASMIIRMGIEAAAEYGE